VPPGPAGSAPVPGGLPRLTVDGSTSAADDGSADAHLDTPYLRHFAAIMGDLLDDGGLTITRLRRIA